MTTMRVKIMTKVMFRKWVVKFIELCICMTVMSVGCVTVALAVGAALRFLGVAYGG